jgi:hypothetical protein
MLPPPKIAKQIFLSFVFILHQKQEIEISRDSLLNFNLVYLTVMQKLSAVDPANKALQIRALCLGAIQMSSFPRQFYNK